MITIIITIVMMMGNGGGVNVRYKIIIINSTEKNRMEDNILCTYCM